MIPAIILLLLFLIVIAVAGRNVCKVFTPPSSVPKQDAPDTDGNGSGQAEKKKLA